jgi:hypothetical protein
MDVEKLVLYLKYLYFKLLAGFRRDSGNTQFGLLVLANIRYWPISDIGHQFQAMHNSMTQPYVLLKAAAYTAQSYFHSVALFQAT